MKDNTKQEKGLIDLIAEIKTEKEIRELIDKRISYYLTKEKLIEIGTEMICRYIMPVLNDNPNVFIELDKGAWAISYDNKYGFIVSKGKASGFRYIAHLLQNEGEKISSIELQNEVDITNTDKTKTERYEEEPDSDEEKDDVFDKEIGDNIDIGLIDDKFSREIYEKYRKKYRELLTELGGFKNSNNPETQILEKETEEEIAKFEDVFSKTYNIPAKMLLGKYDKIPKDKSKISESSKTMVARDIRNALHLIGQDPNISHLKDYLKRTIKRSYTLIYSHDQTKPSWKIFLK